MRLALRFLRFFQAPPTAARRPGPPPPRFWLTLLTSLCCGSVDHIYDTEGCVFRSPYALHEYARLTRTVPGTAGYWSDPARYGSGFDTCAADTVVMPPGECASFSSNLDRRSARIKGASRKLIGKGLEPADKLSNGHTSTFYHGQNPTPTAHPPAKSSQCTKQKTITAARYPTSKARRL